MPSSTQCNSLQYGYENVTRKISIKITYLVHIDSSGHAFKRSSGRRTK